MLMTILLAQTMFGQNKVKVYGQVTDSHNHPVDSTAVWLNQNIDALCLEDKGTIFENCQETFTNNNGCFSMEIELGTYYCLNGIKEADYVKIN